MMTALRHGFSPSIFIISLPVSSSRGFAAGLVSHFLEETNCEFRVLQVRGWREDPSWRCLTLSIAGEITLSFAEIGGGFGFLQYMKVDVPEGEHRNCRMYLKFFVRSTLQCSRHACVGWCVAPVGHSVPSPLPRHAGFVMFAVYPIISPTPHYARLLL